MVHQIEFVQGVLIAATALMALTSLFLTQLKFTRRGQQWTFRRTALIRLLSLSTIAGFAVIACILSWFMSPSDGLGYAIFSLFCFQAFIFIQVAVGAGLFF